MLCACIIEFEFTETQCQLVKRGINISHRLVSQSYYLFVNVFDVNSTMKIKYCLN